MNAYQCPLCDASLERLARVSVALRRIAADYHKKAHQAGRIENIHWWRCVKSPCIDIRQLLEIAPSGHAITAEDHAS